jgi:bacitracin transport ATP-binding protein BcrA
MRNIVEIKEVFKTIDKEEILSGINLQIAEGEIYGFFRTERCWKNNVNEMYVNLINNYIR